MWHSTLKGHLHENVLFKFAIVFLVDPSGLRLIFGPKNIMVCEAVSIHQARWNQMDPKVSCAARMLIGDNSTVVLPGLFGPCVCVCVCLCLFGHLCDA